MSQRSQRKVKGNERRTQRGGVIEHPDPHYHEALDIDAFYIEAGMRNRLNGHQLTPAAQHLMFVLHPAGADVYETSEDEEIDGEDVEIGHLYIITPYQGHYQVQSFSNFEGGGYVAEDVYTVDVLPVLAPTDPSLLAQAAYYIGDD